MDYPPEPAHRPLLHIPRPVAAAIKKAQKTGDWHDAGNTFGAFLLSRWPRNRVIDHLYAPLDELTEYPPITTDGNDRNTLSYRIAGLTYLHARAPFVIAAVPWSNLDAFIDGALAGFYGDQAPEHALAAG